MLTGQNVLLTGAGSPIGQGLVPRILEQDPAVLRLFDSNESHLEELMERFDDDRLRYLMGRVRDGQRVERAMEDIDVVLHISGMRHTEICEQNPFEAVQTNVFGLQNVAEAAIESGVEHVVFISSVDPADPAHTMGAAELLGEKVIAEANEHKDNEKTELVTVRVGNIWHSSDSPMPRFTKQIRDGGPITLGGKGMSRFFFTHDDVSDLILQALTLGQGGEVFISKMPAVWLEDLAEAIVEMGASEYGYDSTEIGITIDDQGWSERSHEQILAKTEDNIYENDILYVVQFNRGNSLFEQKDGFELARKVDRSSKNTQKYSKEDIKSSLTHSNYFD